MTRSLEPAAGAGNKNEMDFIRQTGYSFYNGTKAPAFFFSTAQTGKR